MLHLNPETGETGRCRAEQGGCPFQDPNDPNNGHYETQEEIDSYRERVSELKASEEGLSEGLAVKMSQEEIDRRAKDTHKDLNEAMKNYHDDYADVHKAILPVIDKHFGQGASDKFYKDFKVDEVIERTVNHPQSDSFMAWRASNELEDDGVSLGVDFSKPKGSMLSDNYKEYTDEYVEEGFYVEATNEVFRRALESDKLKGISSGHAQEVIAVELAAGLVSKSGYGKEGKLHETYYEDYAKKHGLIGKKPNLEKYPDSNGYQIPSSEMSEGIKEAAIVMSENKDYSKDTPLGKALAFDQETPYGKGDVRTLKINNGGSAYVSLPTSEMKWEETGDKDKLRTVYESYADGSERVLEYSVSEGKGVLRTRIPEEVKASYKGTKKPVEVFEPTNSLKDDYSNADVKRLLFSELLKNKASANS